MKELKLEDIREIVRDGIKKRIRQIILHDLCAACKFAYTKKKDQNKAFKQLEDYLSKFEIDLVIREKRLK